MEGRWHGRKNITRSVNADEDMTRKERGCCLTPSGKRKRRGETGFNAAKNQREKRRIRGPNSEIQLAKRALNEGGGVLRRRCFTGLRYNALPMMGGEDLGCGGMDIKEDGRRSRKWGEGS